MIPSCIDSLCMEYAESFQTSGLGSILQTFVFRSAKGIGQGYDRDVMMH